MEKEGLIRGYTAVIDWEKLDSAFVSAIIELKDGVECTEQEINDFCAELPRYKRPRKVIFEHVPRNATGKIEKPALREKYCGGRLVEEQTKACFADTKISLTVKL